MANAAVFESGLEQGFQVGEAPRLRKQALADEDFHLKATDLINARSALQSKLTALRDEKGNPLPGYEEAKGALTKANLDLQQLYHPDNNPGALAKFGHLLTDKMHLTDPMKRAQKVGDKKASDLATAQGKSNSVEAALPQSPGQQAVQDENTKGASSLAAVKNVLAEYDELNPKASPEEKSTFRNQAIQSALLGVKIPSASAVGKWDRVQGHLKSSNNPATLLFNEKEGVYKTPTGEEVPQSVLDDFQADPKPSTTNTKPVRAWTKDASGRIVSILLDPKTNQPLPGSENYSLLPPPYLTTKISTGMYHWVDEDSQVHETPETRTTRPVLPSGGAPQGNATPSAVSETMATPKPQGLLQAGNLPIWNRPTVQNDDGSHSSEYSTSFQDDKGREVLVPTVVGGKFLTPDGKKPKPGSPEEKAMFQRAWQHYEQTGENLGVFDNPANANAYAQQLHSRGAKPNASQPKTSQPDTPASSGSPQKSQIKDKILGYKVSAPLTHARQVFSDSVRLAALADRLAIRAAQHPDDMSEADGQFVLSLVRSEAGRVNQQEINMAFQAGGIAEAPERWAAKAGHGSLAPDLRNQLIEFAHDTKDASAEAVAELSHDPAVLNNIANKRTFPKAPDIGTVEFYRDGKHQYKGGDPGVESNWPVVGK